MDWELYERYRATLLLVGVAFLSLLLLAFQRTSAVQHLRAAIALCTLPAERLLSELAVPSPSAVASGPGTPESPAVSPESPAVGPSQHAEQARAMQVLTEENARLHELLDLKRDRWPRAVAAHVMGRDPQRWFQEILIDKGREDGLAVDDPVVAIVGAQEGLVGRIVELGSHASKVMLVQDSLSAVGATVAGKAGDDGVVEGNNEHVLLLKYLSRDSQVKIGDSVVTSGLGGTFPEGIPIGWVEDLSVDARQLFLQARLRPVVLSQRLRLVMVLAKRR